jgi:hypothetical protein
LDELIDLSKNKKPQFSKAVKEMKEKLYEKIKTLYPPGTGFDEMMERAKATVAEDRPPQGWFGWGMGKAAAVAGLAGFAVQKAGAAAGKWLYGSSS